MQGSLEERRKVQKSMVERREDLQKQRCTVETKMQKNGGSSLERILFWERGVGLGVQRSWTESKVGRQNCEAIKREEEETWIRRRYEVSNGCRHSLEEDEAFFLSVMMAERMWRAMGWTCDDVHVWITVAL